MILKWFSHSLFKLFLQWIYSGITGKSGGRREGRRERKKEKEKGRKEKNSLCQSCDCYRNSDLLLWKFLFETLLLSGPLATSLSQWQLWPWPFSDHGLSQRATTHCLACLISHQWLSHSYSFTTKRCFKRPRLVLCVPLLFLQSEPSSQQCHGSHLGIEYSPLSCEAPCTVGHKQRPHLLWISC